MKYRAKAVFCLFLLVTFITSVEAASNRLYPSQDFLLQYQEYAEYEGIIVALTESKTYLHLLVGLEPGEKTKVIPVMLEEAADVEEGDYVRVGGYYIYTFTIWNDPITHVNIALASVLRNSWIIKLGRGIDIDVDKGCGSTYYIGEPITVEYMTRVDAYFAKVWAETPKGDVVLYQGALAAGAYTAKGVIGEPPGSRTFILEIHVKLDEDILGYGESVTLRDECTINAVYGADLAVESIYATGLVECGEGVVKVVVVNSGMGESKPTTVRVYLGNEVIGSAAVPSIEAGGKVEVEVRVKIPCCISAGDLRVEVDAEGLVPEIDEGNNVFTVAGAIAVKKPVLKINVEPPKTTEGSFAVTIFNAGEDEAKNIDLSVDAPPGFEILDIPEVDNLAPGDEQTLLIRFRSKIGTYKLVFTATYSDSCGRSWADQSIVEMILRKELPITLSLSSAQIEALQRVVVTGKAPSEAAGLTLTAVYRFEGGEWREITRIEIGSGGDFYFTFTPEKPGSYEVGVYYPGGGEWAETLVFEKLIVVKIKPTLYIEIPEKAIVGERLLIRGRVEPPREAKGILKFIGAGRRELQFDFKTLPNGTFLVNVVLNATGKWRVEAILLGNEIYEDVSASAELSAFSLRTLPSPGMIVASVATGVAVGVASTFSTVRKIISAIAKKIKGLLGKIKIKVDWLENLAEVYSEEVFKSLTEKEIPPPSKWKIFTKSELKALAVSTLVVAFVLAYMEARTFHFLMNVLIPVAIASLITVIVDELSEATLSKIRGHWAEYSLWPHGALSMIVTGILLNSPFAAPGRTLYAKGYPSREKARLVVYKFMFFLSLAGGFAAAYTAGFEVLGDSGLLTTLTVLFYSLFPVKPLPGYELAVEKKAVWLLTFSIAGVFYFGWLAHSVDFGVYAAIGGLSLAFLAADILATKILKKGLVERLV